jgi:hypothetical protein
VLNLLLEWTLIGCALVWREEPLPNRRKIITGRRIITGNRLHEHSRTAHSDLARRLAELKPH